MKSLNFFFSIFTILILATGCDKEATDNTDTSMGTIRGSINTFDEYAGLIYNERSGVKIDIVNDFQSFSTTTDLAGDYNVASVPNQKYDVKYSKNGFVTLVNNDVNLDFSNSDFPISAGVMKLPIANIYKKVFWSIEEAEGATLQNIVGVDTLYDVKINASLTPAPSQTTLFAGYRVFISANDSVSKSNFVWQKHYTTNTGQLELIITEAEWRALGLAPANSIYFKIYGDIKPDVSFFNNENILIFPGTTENSSGVVEVELE
jgi:hypothetical protein